MRDVSKYIVNNVGEKAPKNYDLLKDIRSQKLYKYNVNVRNTVARQYLNENYEPKSSQAIIPGQLVMFNYFEPKTKEELEYYDAMPMTIFFGVHVTEQGKRVIGFNIHYFPPKMRYKIMERIYEIFKPFYLKSFNDPLTKELSHFDYHWMLEQLEKAGLEFGVRQYDPGLCSKVTPLPTEAWHIAVFTEGVFRKRTREMIMNYWRQWVEHHKK